MLRRRSADARANFLVRVYPHHLEGINAEQVVGLGAVGTGTAQVHRAEGQVEKKLGGNLAGLRVKGRGGNYRDEGIGFAVLLPVADGLTAVEEVPAELGKIGSGTGIVGSNDDGSSFGHHRHVFTEGQVGQLAYRNGVGTGRHFAHPQRSVRVGIKRIRLIGLGFLRQTGLRRLSTIVRRDCRRQHYRKQHQQGQKQRKRFFGLLFHVCYLLKASSGTTSGEYVPDFSYPV